MFSITTEIKLIFLIQWFLFIGKKEKSREGDEEHKGGGGGGRGRGGGGRENAF